MMIKCHMLPECLLIGAAFLSCPVLQPSLAETSARMMVSTRMVEVLGKGMKADEGKNHTDLI